MSRYLHYLEKSSFNWESLLSAYLLVQTANILGKNKGACFYACFLMQGKNVQYQPRAEENYVDAAKTRAIKSDMYLPAKIAGNKGSLF